MTRRSTIQTDFADAIEDAVDRFGDHEDMSAARVVKWLEQFEDADLGLAVQVIEAVHYVNATNIRTLTKRLFEMTLIELKERGLKKAAFVPVGTFGSGSGIVARVLRDSISGGRHKMLTMLEVSQLSPGTYDAIVFVDDFSGTGDTLVGWWESVEPTVRPTNAEVFVGLLVMNAKAHDRIRSFAERVVAVTELGAEDNVLSDEGTAFDDDQKLRILDYCEKTACSPDFRAGYRGCGLLFAFKHGCPNNSLPILWIKNDEWRSLFNRRAI